MTKVILTPAWAIFDSNPASLDKIDSELSYTDKGAQQALIRFRRAERFKQSRMQDPPSWYKPWFDAKVAELKSSVEVHACTRSDGFLMVPVGLYERALALLPPGTGLEITDLRDLNPKRRHIGQGKPPS